MSDPTYRIDVEHKQTQHYPEGSGSSWLWVAKIVRLSDGATVEVLASRDAEEAQEQAQAWLAEQNRQQPSFSLFVDDDGRPVEGHSVKA